MRERATLSAPAHRLLRQACVLQCPVAVMVETELAHPTRTQPAQQRGWTLVNLDAAALGVTALSREHHDHFVAVEEPLRLAAIGLPDISDLGAPKKESLVT